MRYYETEPEAVYRQVAREHTTQWSDAFEPGRPGGFDDFPNRAFLERVLPELGGVADVLEYGCGTGPAACFLAQRGLRVDAVDVSPEAIRLARQFADERGLRVNFAVQDVCRWPAADKRYDLVVDSYCLQNIVLDEDRAALFRGVRDRLAPTGHYLISTALYEPDRVYGDGLRYDAATGVCYREGLPYRRHLTAAALHAELTAAGFTVLSLTDGNVVSRRASGTTVHEPVPAVILVGVSREPRLEIEYCTQCRWLLRAAWTAQELLTTFTTELGEVALVPGTGGIFDVRLDGETLWSRKAQNGFPEIAPLKQLVRDRIAPDRDLGHSDRR